MNGPESSLEGGIFMFSWARKLIFWLLSPRVYIGRKSCFDQIENAGHELKRLRHGIFCNSDYFSAEACWLQSC